MPIREYDYIVSVPIPEGSYFHLDCRFEERRRSFTCTVTLNVNSSVTHYDRMDFIEEYVLHNGTVIATFKTGTYGKP